MPLFDIFEQHIIDTLLELLQVAGLQLGGVLHQGHDLGVELILHLFHKAFRDRDMSVHLGQLLQHGGQGSGVEALQLASRQLAPRLLLADEAVHAELHIVHARLGHRLCDTLSDVHERPLLLDAKSPADGIDRQVVVEFGNRLLHRALENAVQQLLALVGVRDGGLQEEALEGRLVSLGELGLGAQQHVIRRGLIDQPLLDLRTHHFLKAGRCLGDRLSHVLLE